MKINKQNDILNWEKKLTRDIKNIITEVQIMKDTLK